MRCCFCRLYGWGQIRLRSFIRFFCILSARYCAFPLALKWKVEGAENLHKFRPCVLVLNHQSFLDIHFVHWQLPSRRNNKCKKMLLKYMPFFGWLCCLSKNSLHQACGTSAAKESVEIMIQRMKHYEVGKILHFCYYSILTLPLLSRQIRCFSHRELEILTV